MARQITTAVLCAAITMLTACETPGPIFVKDPQLVASPDKVSIMLAQAADKSAAALETLAAVEQRRTPAATIAPISGAPAELRRAVTVNWIGPADEIVTMLANRASYNFVTLGDAPATPIVVSVDVTNKPIIEVLRSVGLQLGARADIHVDSERKVVEIQYASVLGGGDLMTPLATR